MSIETDIRETLIQRGLIRPAKAGVALSVLRLPPGTRVLRLDEAGRFMAERRVSNGGFDPDPFDTPLAQGLAELDAIHRKAAGS